MASWSPSQSEPLTVSYICHCQLSSPMLPSDAAIPPYAATVWRRVRETLVMQAVMKPCRHMPKVARRPAPPAPTTTTSYSWSTMVKAAMTLAPQGDDQSGNNGQGGQGITDKLRQDDRGGA